MPTLKHTVKISGRGIHSGLPAHMTLRPRRTPGIFFVRTDVPNAPQIPATYDHVGDTKLRNTTIGTAPHQVQTVEHLMAALLLAGVDAATIEIDGPETPICDGSARVFLDAIRRAGVTDGKMQRIIVRRPVTVSQREALRQLPWRQRMMVWLMNKIQHRRSDGFVRLSPGDAHTLRVRATLVYPEKIIGHQTYEYAFDGSAAAGAAFDADVSAARTFGKFSEWEYLKRHGMGRGADETNVIALNDAGDGTLNPLYWPDEFVRHKVIDALGDMYTSGGLVCGFLESYKGSHALNNLVLKKLFSDPANYDIVDDEPKR
ncbi:hypothetical protein HDR63_03355 [bacterium]|nr:hypothetical protein [bacterium]